MKPFTNIEEFGDIYVDRILFEANEPILFTCKNSENNLFLVVCCTSNNEMKKWLITHIDVDSLIKLLTDEITIRCAFLYKTKYKYTRILRDDKDVIIENVLADWSENSKFLPTTGEFMDVEEYEFEDDIQYFNSIREKKGEVVIDYVSSADKVNFHY